MNNQINNPKTEVPKGKSFNDKDYMNQLLSCLKEMIKNYSVVVTEASNETLFNEYKIMLDEFINLQREVYEEMFRNGWYSLEKVDNSKLSNKFQTLTTEFNDLNI